MHERARLLVCLCLASGCPIIESGDKTDTGETDTDTDSDSDSDSDSDTDTDTERCRHEGVGPNSANDPIVAHCHEYQGPDDGSNQEHYSPSTPLVVGDCFDPDPLAPTYLGVSDDGDSLAETVGFNLCEAGDGFGTWAYEFDAPSCSDYTDDGHNWVLIDALNGGFEYQYWSDSVHPDCPHTNYFPPIPPSPQILRASAPIACVAGSATFDLVARHAVGQDANGDRSLQLVPIATSNAQFPERAWLRSITVVSWGTATKLRIASVGTALQFSSDGTVSGGSLLQVPATQITLPAGVATMSGQLATWGLDTMAETVDLPRVTMSWSCEVNAQNPHYGPVPTHQAYIADLSEWGVPHRMLFWVDTTHHMLRIAPVGRLGDALPMSVSPNGHFRGEIPVLGATLEGVLSTVGQQLRVNQGRLTVGGSDPIEIEVLGSSSPRYPRTHP